VLLMWKFLHAIHSTAEDVFIFRQHKAPAHGAHATDELLCRDTPQFINPDMWPAKSPDLNLVLIDCFS